VSISLSPALNPDMAGFTGSFFNRLRLLLLAVVCFMVEGRDVLGLGEERPENETPAQGRPSGSRYRAITSLYAGTAPAASRLNGKVKHFFWPSRIASSLVTNTDLNAARV
jgi:hypothetical protein